MQTMICMYCIYSVMKILYMGFLIRGLAHMCLQLLKVSAPPPFPMVGIMA